MGVHRGRQVHGHEGRKGSGLDAMPAMAAGTIILRATVGAMSMGTTDAKAWGTVGPD